MTSIDALGVIVSRIDGEGGAAVDSYQLGVDLGTTYTAAAVGFGAEAKMVSLGTRLPEVPSVVAFVDGDTVLVGEAAERRALSEPEQIVREFKRRFGDPTPLMIGGVARSAESVTAALLRSVVDLVSAQQGSRPGRVVLTHPASWSHYRMDLFRQIVLLADLDNVVFLSEPEAAADYYATQTAIESGDIALVFDFGGGTFDSAVLRAAGSGFDILGDSKGLEHLGGIDLDHVVFEHVLTSIDLDLGSLEDTPLVRSAVGRLRADCVTAKESLSADTVAVVPVMLPTVHTEVRLTRGEFESMIRPLVLDAVSVVRSTVAGAGLEIAAIDQVLLVGGSSRIPLVSQILNEQLQRPVRSDAHPKHTVALGAALHAPLQVPTDQPSPVAPDVPIEVLPVDTAPIMAMPGDLAPVRADVASASSAAPAPLRQPENEQAVDRAFVAPPSGPAAPTVPPAADPTEVGRNWQRWAVPLVALGVAAGAFGWLANERRDGSTSASTPLDAVAEGSNDSSGTSTASTSAAANETPTTGALPNADEAGDADLADGTLPFRVVESESLGFGGGVDVVGSSKDFVFAFDHDQTLSGVADAIVLDRLGQVVTTFSAGDGFITGTLDRGSEVWLSVANSRAIVIFDIECLCVSGEVAVGSIDAQLLVEHAGLIWVVDYDRQAGESAISLVDPVSRSIVGTLDVGSATSDRAYQHGAVQVGDQLWAADAENMWTFDLVSQAVVSRTELGAENLSDSVELGGSVLVTDWTTGMLYAIDTADSTVRSIQLAVPGDDYFTVSSPVVDTAGGLVWVSSYPTEELLAVDPVSMRIVHRIAVEGPVGRASIVEDHIVLPVGGARLFVVDPASGAVVADLPGAGAVATEVPFLVVAVDDSAMWLLPPFSANRAKIYLIEPLD